jgi:hypothetical protein
LDGDDVDFVETEGDQIEWFDYLYYKYFVMVNMTSLYW